MDASQRHFPVYLHGAQVQFPSVHKPYFPTFLIPSLAREEKGDTNEGDLRGLLGFFSLTGRTASEVPVTNLSRGQLLR